MQSFGVPVAIDASHSVQKPGGEGESSGGERAFIPLIARAGVAAGADGVFLEIHDNPDKARSDKHNSFHINELEALCRSLLRLREAL
jgi:2-dehydro-3-deoxyphosphooctonate aldolase (KDO 8-P synthase)